MKATVRRTKHNGKLCWMVDLQANGRRRRTFYKTKALADTSAEEFRFQAARRGELWTSLSLDDRCALVDLLTKARAAGLTVQQVWDSHLANRASKPIEQKTLADAIAGCLQSKLAMNRRERYVTGLGEYLRLFARGRESMTVDQVTPAMINEWFGARHEAASSRVSNLGRLSALFTWAVRQGYATENPCAHIDKPTIESQAPIILTVRQAARLVALCFRHKPQALAWVVVGMFAGLRPEEADKLKWDDVDLDHGLIRLDAASSKVRQRRIIHLETNCQEWLKVSKAIGSALPFPKPTRRRYVRALREAMGWEEWPQDVLRHSAASYLLAKHQDAGRVASELGNSPGILLRHYKELVYKTDAERYWAIRPKARHQKEAGASLK